MFCTLHESELPLLALSIRQPWAHAIAMGCKDIENRSWNTSQRGLICIHASAYTKRNFEEDRESYLEVVHDYVRASSQSELANIEESELSFGAIIGIANLVDVRRDHESPWFFGRYGFVLKDRQILEKPIRVKGALGFFDWRPRLAIPAEKPELKAEPRSRASSEMTAQSFISKLSERTCCPACGSPRSEFITVPNGGYELHQAVLEFECDATFRSSHGISLIYPCPARSVLAAEMMTIEVEGRMK